jgi:hypothetical protein
MKASEIARRRYKRLPPLRSANVRTACVLLSIALVYFGGIIYSQYTGIAAAGIGVVGLGIVGMLLVTTGFGIRK